MVFFMTLGDASRKLSRTVKKKYYTKFQSSPFYFLVVTLNVVKGLPFRSFIAAEERVFYTMVFFMTLGDASRKLSRTVKKNTTPFRSFIAVEESVFYTLVSSAGRGR
jgi:hypothetical protein